MQTDNDTALDIAEVIEPITESDTPAMTGEHITTSFSFSNGRFEVSSNGVFYVPQDDEGNDGKSQKVCSELHVTALTRNSNNTNWGRLLEWRDMDNHPHHWAMPMELLKGDGADIRGYLLDNGLKISNRTMLTNYIQEAPAIERVLCVDRLGWYGSQFVTPNEVIGGMIGERVVYQSTNSTPPAVNQQGTISDWTNSIGRYASGNSRLVFAISLAFAPTLMDLIGIEGGGFHLRGGSSAGKSTAQHVAASVWGRGSDYVRNWRVTSNGMEGLAVMHNDGLLVLDEISQIDPKHLAETSYMLANGMGKVRALKSGTAKPAAQWKLLMLSSGEESLSAILAKANIKTNAGQEVRLADIEADAGAGMGVIEQLHDMPNSKELSDYLKRQASQCYGSIGKAWLEWVVSEREQGKLASHINDLMAAYLKWLLPNGASGQVQRVASRFALVAAAGELATKAGLTGWEAEEASNSVNACFNNWLDGYGGTGNKEASNIISHVKGFIEQHGSSRFESVNSDGTERVINRVGFVRHKNEQM
ncbi:MAG: DUF927 domain-containing protein, partial [Gammaproteobacteria bacterium]|nr:DUF927 domain-containing protein [Gammaproteobacteria bacterium]